MRIKITGTYDREDFEVDNEAFTGLTEGAYQSLCDVMADDGFEIEMCEYRNHEVWVTFNYEPEESEQDPDHDLGVTPSAYVTLSNGISDHGITVDTWVVDR
jgi:hypothetical protein